MSKFKYIGNHPEITQHDVTFKQGEPVDVSNKVLTFRTMDNGKKVERKIKVEDKLRGNPAFEEVFEEVKRRGRPPNGNKGTDQKQSIAQA